MTSERAQELLGRIRDRNARVAIVGLGYVGLPLGLTFCEKGFDILGFDVDRALGAITLGTVADRMRGAIVQKAA